MRTFKSLTKSLPWENCHGKDSMRDILRLDDKPRTKPILWQQKDNKPEEETTQVKQRTEKKDLQRVGPTESTTLPVIFYTE